MHRPCDIPPAPLLGRDHKGSLMSLQKKPLVPPALVSSTVPADVFERIANALERLAPPHPRPPDFTIADAYIWHPAGRTLAPVPRVNRVDMSLLKGIDRMRDILVENTERFARGLPANNALLCGVPYRFLIFCDDLSFDNEDTSYKSLKAVLDGGIEGRPDNVILYATY